MVQLAALVKTKKTNYFNFDLSSVPNAPITANNILHYKVVWLILQHSFTIRSMCQRALPRPHLC